MSMGSRMLSAFAAVPSVSLRGAEGKEGGGGEEEAQLEEGMTNMLLAEANSQLRQLQGDLQLEREQSSKLRDQMRQLLSADAGATESMERMQEADVAVQQVACLCVTLVRVCVDWNRSHIWQDDHPIFLSYIVRRDWRTYTHTHTQPRGRLEGASR